LLPLDTIVAVDGRSVKGLSLYEVEDALQGSTNSKVVLTIGRTIQGRQDYETVIVELNVAIARQEYSIDPVQSKLCEAAPGSDGNTSDSAHSTSYQARST